MSSQRFFPGLLVLVAVSILDWTASASDGVLEINQTCAVQTGCFSGDGSGFPVVITTAGSYRLTGNLNLAVAASPANTNAIEIRVDGVTVDLGGFMISGPTTCSVGVCAPTGLGIGVEGNGQGTHRDIAVHNGYIRGMGAGGVSCDRGCTIESVRVESCGGDGLSNSNGPALYRANVVRNNGGSGIFGTGTFIDNIAELNQGTGIFTNPGSLLRGNTIRDNTGSGVRCFNCTMVDNMIYSNDGFGVLLNGPGALEGNAIQNNVAGTISISGGTLVQTGANMCASDSVCP